MNKSLIGIIAALVFGVATAGAFYWLWTTAQSETTTTASAATYQVVEIESVKKEATDILSTLQKSSDIPVGVPVEKMGRANPYTTP